MSKSFSDKNVDQCQVGNRNKKTNYICTDMYICTSVYMYVFGINTGFRFLKNYSFSPQKQKILSTYLPIRPG